MHSRLFENEDASKRNGEPCHVGISTNTLQYRELASDSLIGNRENDWFGLSSKGYTLRGLHDPAVAQERWLSLACVRDHPLIAEGCNVSRHAYTTYRITAALFDDDWCLHHNQRHQYVLKTGFIYHGSNRSLAVDSHVIKQMFRLLLSLLCILGQAPTNLR